MRKKIVAGNWKMNLTFNEAEDLLDEIVDLLEDETIEAQVIVCPPYPYLEMAGDIAKESNFSVGAQNISPFESGAYTGEVSSAMLKSMEISYCIIGHSERRKYFNEDDKMLTAKVNQAIQHQIAPIFCVGEALPERESGKHFEIVRHQVRHGLFHLDANEFSKVLIAYEPVWAIGTGVTAQPEQAREMHEYIRSLIEERYGKEIAKATLILYGGSCNSKNADEIFAQPGVDGGLIGGASLIAEEFLAICKAAK